MDEKTLNIIKIGAGIGFAAGIVRHASKPTESELVQQEIDARALRSMSVDELVQKQAGLKAEEQASGKIWFWVLMFVGMFVFPFVCVPICIIGLIREVFKRFDKTDWLKLAAICTMFGILIGAATNEYWWPKDKTAAYKECVRSRTVESERIFHVCEAIRNGD